MALARRVPLVAPHHATRPGRPAVGVTIATLCRRTRDRIRGGRHRYARARRLSARAVGGGCRAVGGGCRAVGDARAASDPAGVAAACAGAAASRAPPRRARRLSGRAIAAAVAAAIAAVIVIAVVVVVVVFTRARGATVARGALKAYPGADAPSGRTTELRLGGGGARKAFRLRRVAGRARRSLGRLHSRLHSRPHQLARAHPFGGRPTPPPPAAAPGFGVAGGFGLAGRLGDVHDGVAMPASPHMVQPLLLPLRHADHAISRLLRPLHQLLRFLELAPLPAEHPHPLSGRPQPRADAAEAALHCQHRARHALRRRLLCRRHRPLHLHCRRAQRAPSLTLLALAYRGEPPCIQVPRCRPARCRGRDRRGDGIGRRHRRRQRLLRRRRPWRCWR